MFGAHQDGVCQDSIRTINRKTEISRSALSPDGKILAVAEGSPKKLVFIDVDTGETIEGCTTTADGRPREMLFSKNGDYLICISSSRVNTVCLSEDRNAIESNETFQIDYGCRYFAIASEKPLLAGVSPRQLRIYNYESGELVTTFNLTHFKDIQRAIAVHISANGGQVLIAGRKSVLLVDVESKEAVQHWTHGETISTGSFDENGTSFSGAAVGRFYSADLISGEIVKQELRSTTFLNKINDSSDELFVCGSKYGDTQGFLAILDASTLEEKYRLAVPCENREQWRAMHMSKNAERLVIETTRTSLRDFNYHVIDLKRE